MGEEAPGRLSGCVGKGGNSSFVVFLGTGVVVDNDCGGLGGRGGGESERTGALVVGFAVVVDVLLEVDRVVVTVVVTNFLVVVG